MTAFQIVCLVFLPFAYVLLARADRGVPGALPIVFVAGWIGEATSIAWYGYYHYEPTWWWRVAGVPLLVPLIWPAVILSGRMVAKALWPDLRRGLPWVVGAIVFFDAAMVEVVAVQCGLWHWTQPGYLGVPLVGVVGWAIFAVAVTWLMERLRGARRWAIVLVAPVLLHVALVASWWVFFKWFWRGDWFGLFVAIAAALTVVAWRIRGNRRMPMAIALPRLMAAGIFVGLLLVAAPLAGRVWLHVALTSVPYALVTERARIR